MPLLDTITTDIITAMKAKDASRLSALRMLKTSLTNAAIAAKGAGKVFDDAAALACAQSHAKKLREAITEYRAGAREDLAAATSAECAMIEAYLPQQMSEDDVCAAVARIRAATGATDVGPLTGAVMKELKGKADGAVVRRVVEQVLTM